MFWSQPGRTLQTALLEREIGEGGLGDGEIGWGCSWDECFEPGWAGAASERNHRALPLAGCSSPSPSPALYQPRCLCSYVWTRGELIQLKTGPKKKKRGVYLYQTVPSAGVPYCCTNSSPGKGVVTSNNQASWSKAEIILFVCGGVKCQTNHSLIFYPLHLPQIFPNTSIWTCLNSRV